uniref:FecR domain-containing protein n=1 Tax=Desertifilum tharense IPPAS B-1220 TaxID=1781255 RepID=A0ACD5H295_9CYAN
MTGGQARFRVRRFNHPGSSLEIETPAGSSAVRGTEFGVSVHPDGKTGIATREGTNFSRSPKSIFAGGVPVKKCCSSPAYRLRENRSL